jgi:BirA family transcriptional regulator, biotin operon repressor / biotin---[acetyl-CoA-carboxylase] ligase
MNTPPPPPADSAFSGDEQVFSRDEQVFSGDELRFSRDEQGFSRDELRFSRDELDRIVAETFVERVEHRAELASTNSRALELAGEESAACTLVVADRQTDGRGRGANRWWSAAGALTFSVLLKPDRLSLPTRRWPQVSLTTGLAVCDAVDELLGDSAARLKWPNDVYLDGRKVCGILVEANDGRERNLVVGVGVNVNNSASSAPAELRATSVALCDVAGRSLPRVDVLIAILQQLARQLDRLGRNLEELPTQWTRRCLLTGRRVEIELTAGRRTGVCRGIDAEGALILETDGGTERFVSGVVTRFE